MTAKSIKYKALEKAAKLAKKQLVLFHYIVSKQRMTLSERLEYLSKNIVDADIHKDILMEPRDDVLKELREVTINGEEK